MRIWSTLFLFPAVVALSQLAPAEDAKDVQQKLETKYKLTVINAEGGVVIQGVILTLKKNGLTAGANSCANEYKDGNIGLTGTSKATCGTTRRFGIPIAVGGGSSRPFVTGEKLDVTKVEVRESTVAFSLVSDPINNVIYKAELRFQFPKGVAPDSAKTDQLVGEVFTISQDNPQGGGGGTTGGQAAAGAPSATPNAAPAQQPEALAPIAPPPPPSDAPAAPPPTVSLGMNPEQVIGIMGQPTARASVGNKQIYTYPGLKITFVDGKVSDVQ